MTDILAIGAHPDDVEIGCAGVLAAAVLSGADVAIVDATAGEAATHGTADERAKERMRAAEILGVGTRLLLGLPDTGVGVNAAHREQVVDVLRDLRPRIVLAPFIEDKHPDHAALGRIVREAAHLAGVGGKHPRPARVFHYLVHHDFTPSFIVDVSGTWERKMEALDCYRSQFAPLDPATEIAHGFLDVVEARGVYHGSLIGAARGEAFWCPGPVPLSALPDVDGSRYSAFR